jgi:hypothetical protein
MGNIEPELLGGIVGAVPEAVNSGATAQSNPPGLQSLAQKFGSKESRRGLAIAASILESIGKSLGQKRNVGH